MSDTTDRLVRMLDEERASLRQTKEDRMIADRATLAVRADLDLARRDRENARSDLEIAERVIAEWEAFKKKHRGSKGLSKMPAKYYRSDVPF